MSGNLRLTSVNFFPDILLNFRTTFVNQRGEVVTNSKDIAINYLKTWFFLDLVAALPFDFLDLFQLNQNLNLVNKIFSFLLFQVHSTQISNQKKDLRKKIFCSGILRVHSSTKADATVKTGQTGV